MRKKELIAVFAFALILIQGICLSEEAKRWEPYYFGSATEGGLAAENEEGIILSLDKAGAFGLYNPSKFSGNFDAQAEIISDKGPCGMILFKDNGGKPDPSNFVGIERKTDGDGNETVRVFAIGDGQDFTRKGAKGDPRFEYVLNNDSFGREAKALRILKDEKSGCFHFYYKYERKVDGEKKEGWMELSTLPDWDDRPFYFYPYVKSNGDFTAKAVFIRPMVMLTPEDDGPDKNTGFKASRRDYTFSGFSGDAVVVTFDREFPFYEKAKFVFWSEAEYIPWWHIDDKCAVYYGFCEIRGGGTEGSDEPTGDRLLRWTKAEIVESNKARVIVRWRYVLADPEYRWWSMDPIEKPYVDEWYCFYPDGIGVRKVTYTPITTTKYETGWNGISELGVVRRGGVKPSEIIEQKAVSILNLDGKRVDYSWDLSKDQPPAKRDEDTKNWPEAICRINLKNRPAVFEVFAQGEDAYKKTFPAPFKDWSGNYGEDWAFETKGGNEFEGDFGVFSHWPISKMPHEEPDKTKGKYIREPGHTPLLPVAGHPKVKGPTTWAMLVGMSGSGESQYVRDRTSSWISPGDATMIDENAEFVENDYYQRALVFETDKSDRGCHFTMYPKIMSSIVINPVFIIRNWGNFPVSINMNGKTLKEDLDYRYAIEGDSAVIWVKARFSGLTTFLIK